MANGMYKFEMPNKQNVRIGDLLVARDVNGLGTDGIVPVSEVRDDGVVAQGTLLGCKEYYETAVIFTREGKILAGKKAQEQIRRDLAYVLSRANKLD